MKWKSARRSDRVVIELPIVVTGSDASGAAFLIPGRTTVVSRHGAHIVLPRQLPSLSSILIRCLPTAREARGRATGSPGLSPDGSICYGIELLNPETNLWDIEFPPIEEAEGAAGRVVLQCAQCDSRELVYLSDIQAQALGADKSLTRYCRKCATQSMWKEFGLKAQEELLPRTSVTVETSPPSPMPAGAENRKYPRLDVTVSVCVRHPESGEDFAATVNISRGGFRFTSSKHYREGWIIEVALPYCSSGANIFATGRVVYAAKFPGGGISVYGVMYVPYKPGRVGR